jgi:hypothetical protein
MDWGLRMHSYLELALRVRACMARRWSGASVAGGSGLYR